MSGSASMVFAYLSDYPQLAPQLAALHHAEWGELMPGWSAAQALSELQSHRQRSAIPTTLLALDKAAGADLVGSVSLLAEDDPRLPGYSPWLASLYVLPAWRGRGYGAALVQRAVQEAARIGVPRLYLFTAGQQNFYARLGWRLIETVALAKATAHIMAIESEGGGAHARVF